MWKFCIHSKIGRSDTDLDYIVKFIHILFANQFIATLAFKYPNFCYRGNKAWLGASLNDASNFIDAENP